MRLLKTKTFSRWARKQGLRDRTLREAAEEMRHGQVDAQLGSGLAKKRLAQAYLGLDEEAIEQGLVSGQLVEIDGGESQTA